MSIRRGVFASSKMVFLVVLCAFLGSLFSVRSFATEESSESPRWSFEFKLGQFRSALEEWDTYYDSNPLRLSVGWAYKIFRPLEIGVSLGQIRTDGVGNFPIQQAVGGEVDFTLVPLNVSLLYRLILYEDQMFVPYIGGGWTRLYYRQETLDGDKTEGFRDGRHVKLGVQFLLDSLDKSGARNVQRRLGVENTYLFLEVQSIEAIENQMDLGGDSVSLGLLMEY